MEVTIGASKKELGEAYDLESLIGIKVRQYLAFSEDVEIEIGDDRIPIKKGEPYFLKSDEDSFEVSWVNEIKFTKKEYNGTLEIKTFERIQRTKRVEITKRQSAHS